MQFITKQVKHFPIWDLFLFDEQGWSGWTRVLVKPGQITILAGRQLDRAEKHTLKSLFEKG